jgi:hypothetical protein
MQSHFCAQEQRGILQAALNACTINEGRLVIRRAVSCEQTERRAMLAMLGRQWEWKRAMLAILGRQWEWKRASRESAANEPRTDGTTVPVSLASSRMRRNWRTEDTKCVEGVSEWACFTEILSVKAAPNFQLRI